MESKQLDIKVKFIRGFADKTRLQILESIGKHEKSVTEIVGELQGNQSNISQHLACLKGCGIIESRQEGKYVYYSLRNEQIAGLLSLMDFVFQQVEEEVAACEKNNALDCCANTRGGNKSGAKE